MTNFSERIPVVKRRISVIANTIKSSYLRNITKQTVTIFTWTISAAFCILLVETLAQHPQHNYDDMTMA
jgi:hypothetical protein